MLWKEEVREHIRFGHYRCWITSQCFVLFNGISVMSVQCEMVMKISVQ